MERKRGKGGGGWEVRERRGEREVRCSEEKRGRERVRWGQVGGRVERRRVGEGRRREGEWMGGWQFTKCYCLFPGGGSGSQSARKNFVRSANR